MKSIIDRSDAFKNFKFNNYDNLTRFAPVKMTSEYDLFPGFKVMDQAADYQDNKESVFVKSRGSMMGPNQKAFVFTSSPKNNQRSRVKSMTQQTTQESIANHQSKISGLNNIYATNLSNLIAVNRKIVRNKNYEMDQRSFGLKHDDKFHDKVERLLSLQRSLENTNFNQNELDKNVNNHQPYYKNFTTITKFSKNLYDTRITKNYGPKYLIYRD